MKKIKLKAKTFQLDSIIPNSLPVGVAILSIRIGNLEVTHERLQSLWMLPFRKPAEINFSSILFIKIAICISM